MSSKISIAVVDDHPLFRQGVVNVLNASDRFDIVGEGATADQAVALVADTAPDLLLVDLHLPGGGLEAAETILAAGGRTKIVVLSVVEDRQVVAKAFRIGVCGYLLKGISSSDLIKAAEAAAAGEYCVSPQLMGQLLGRPPEGTSAKADARDPAIEFAGREEQILSLLSHGMSNKEMAFHLQICEKTVKYYLTHIMKKLRVRNRVEVALFASRRSLGDHPGRMA